MGIKIQQATLALLPSFHHLPLKREDARKTDMQSLIRIHLNHSKIIRDLEALHSLIQVLLVILASPVFSRNHQAWVCLTMGQECLAEWINPKEFLDSQPSNHSHRCQLQHLHQGEVPLRILEVRT